MCHNGNGVAITSAHLAHGLNKHWLWPLYPKDHIEAGCVQCHQKDVHLPMGERVTAGKNTFRHVGCWGCHKYEGFNTEVDEIVALESRRKDIAAAQRDKLLRQDNLRAVLGAISEDDQDSRDRESPSVDRAQATLGFEIAELETERQRIGKRLGELHAERQRVGPNLKDLRVKIRREFLTEWIRNPREAHKDASGMPFRPDTRMPTFRWWGDADEEVKDVAAFLWQNSLDPAQFPGYREQLPAFTPGDAKRGETLVRSRGCVACHSIGTGEDRIGSEYATNLSNLGEKNTPEWVARWVTHPRQRLVGYDPSRPPGERDVASAKPGDPGIVWTQPTIMPNFRLDESEVRDITTYLVSQRRPDVKYDDAAWLDDPSRRERGRKLVLFQGCAGCHEIKGLEDEKGIGTELTQEGSKPLERLDFGHHTIAAERGVETLKGVDLPKDAETLFTEDKPWYRPLGFILHKVAKPDFFDQSKYLPDRINRLRMPQFTFSAQEVKDVTTFVLGSVDTKIPQSFRYDPQGRARAIRDGWWVVKKYNCQACHQIEPNDVPDLWSVPGFREAARSSDMKPKDATLPPTLVGAGYRLTPDALARFLRDPSLGGGRADPVSTREHLAVRMPTFDFSEGEIEKLVLFFQALADQPAVYQAPQLKPLTEAELSAARAIYNAPGSCSQCHIVQGMKPGPETRAPNFSFAPARLRADWAHRWIEDPPAMNPRTSMLKLFEPKEGVWRFLNRIPEVDAVPGDHIDLMVRYLLLGQAGK
jgi:cytochrome c2